MRTFWKYIILYLVIVLGLSYPVQRGYFNEFFSSIAGSTFLAESGYLLAGFSTFFGATIVLFFHKDISNRITIFGEEKLKYSLIAGLPIFAFSIVGLDNNFGMNNYLYGFLYATINTVYAFAEEFGWRRYLQNALESINKNWKYLLIGFVWWIWHFRYETDFDLYIFPLICLGGGFMLGKLADEGKSILPVVSMHTLIILTTNSGSFGNNKMFGVVIVVLGWYIIEQYWKSKSIVELGE